MTSDFGDLDDILNQSPNASLANPQMIDAGAKIVSTIWQAGTEAWGVLLNRGVLFSEGGTDYTEPSRSLDDDIGECLITTVEWSGDRQGTVYFVVPALGAKAVVAYMMALMMGTDAVPEQQELDADAIDAYTEAISQFIGSSAQALRADPGGTVSFSPKSTEIVDLSTDTFGAFATEDALCTAGQLTIEGASPITVYTIMTPSVTGMETIQQGSHAADEAFVDDVVKRAPEEAKGGRERVRSLKLPVKVILAERTMRMSDLMKLNPGSIIEFRKSSDEMLDLHAGNVPIATGEVVITREHFGLQIRHIRPKQPPKPKLKVISC